MSSFWAGEAGYTLLPIRPWAPPQPSLPGCSLGDTPAHFGGTSLSRACWLPLGLAQVLPSCVRSNKGQIRPCSSVELEGDPGARGPLGLRRWLVNTTSLGSDAFPPGFGGCQAGLWAVQGEVDSPGAAAVVAIVTPPSDSRRRCWLAYGCIFHSPPCYPQSWHQDPPHSFSSHSSSGVFLPGHRTMETCLCREAWHPADGGPGAPESPRNPCCGSQCGPAGVTIPSTPHIPAPCPVADAPALASRNSAVLQRACVRGRRQEVGRAAPGPLQG